MANYRQSELDELLGLMNSSDTTPLTKMVENTPPDEDDYEDDVNNYENFADDSVCDDEDDDPVSDVAGMKPHIELAAEEEAAEEVIEPEEDDAVEEDDEVDEDPEEIPASDPLKEIIAEADVADIDIVKISAAPVTVKRTRTPRDPNAVKEVKVKGERKQRVAREKTVKVEVPAEPLPDWAISFKNNPGDISFSEYGSDYHYAQQKSPSGDPMGYFAAYYRHDAESPWQVHTTGLLSEMYVAVRVETMMTVLCGAVDSTQVKINSSPFALTARVKTHQTVTVMSDESERIAYEMVCGKSGDDLETQFTIEIAALTAYNGTRRLLFDYVISNGDRTTNNYFVLGSQVQMLRHHSGSDLTAVAAGVRPVSELYAETSEKLRSHKAGFDGWVDILKAKLKKSQMNTFGQYVEGLGVEHRNLLTLSVILSKVLDNDYDPRQHFVLRSEFAKIVEGLK